MQQLPQVSVKQITRTPYGFDSQGELVNEVRGVTIYAASEAMRVTLQDQMNAQPQESDSADTLLKAATDLWLKALNETLGETDLVSEVWLKSNAYHFSAEFFYLANTYAIQICGDEALYMCHLARCLVPGVLQNLGASIPLARLYSNIEMLFYPTMALDLRVVASARNTITIRWAAASTLATVSHEYRDSYQGFIRLLIRTIFEQLPMLLGGESIAQVTAHAADEDTNEWRITWRQPPDIPVYSLAGLGLSIILAIITIVGGISALAYVVVVPVLLGLGWDMASHQRQQMMLSQMEQLQLQNAELSAAHANVRSASIAHEQQIKDMLTVREAVIDMSATVDQADIMERIIEVVTNRLHFDRAMVLLRNRDSGVLTFGTISHPPDDASDQMRLSRLHLDVEADDSLNMNDPLLGPWLRAKSLLIEDSAVYMESRLNWVLTLLKFNIFYSVPLVLGGDLLGVLLVDNLFMRRPITKEDRNVVDALATNIAITMENARLYDLQDEQLSQNLEEMRIMEQIDRDLADTLLLNNVLELLMDWALRFTNAGFSAVMLVDPAIRTGRIAAYYGCTEDQLPGGRLATPLPLEQMGISGRAALTGETQVVRDVSRDPDHLKIIPGMVAQITVPITRQRRVVGVMSLETGNPDGFDAGHVTFLNRLATRAGVALENARLFTESQQERGKLSAIIKQTTDAVVVVDYSEEILLLNLAALRVFRLSGEPEDYLGKNFNRVFGTTPLAVFYSALQYGQNSVSEIPIGDRTFHVGGTEVEGVGYSMILHDVSPFIEVDRLKNELVSSVSHDLKNPLSVMRGFVDLIEMTQGLNERGSGYVKSIHHSIDNMRQLIDNILDLAKVETGIHLDLQPLNLAELVADSQREMSLIAKEKGITFSNQFRDDLPPALGDEARVRQIIANLMNNAVKYSLETGEITVNADQKDGQVRLSIADQGVGIAESDLDSIWDRFVRVRNEQTKDIEGTGLGLAIVKSLVEAHGGTVGVESKVDQGSTFWFTLPISGDK